MMPHKNARAFAAVRSNLPRRSLDRGSTGARSARDRRSRVTRQSLIRRATPRALGSPSQRGIISALRMESKLSLSVVVPVYNSEALLRPLVARLEPVLRDIAGEFELVLVNDGSRDRSWNVVRELCAEHPWIRAIDMMRNYGQHNAILCGIRAARHSIIVTMDDDLQHPPEEIPKLLAVLDPSPDPTSEARVDVVYGTPEKETHGFLRDLASQMTKLALQKSMGAETARKVSAFRAFRTELRRCFADYKSQFVSIDVLLTWGTTKFKAVAVKHDPRSVGASNYTYRKLLTHALNMMTGFSVMPLQLASVIGFAFTLFGIVLLIVVAVNYLVRSSASPPGFTFIASVIAIFSGAQLFALGIIGEYLARMHFRMMDRPPYSVRSELAGGDGARSTRGAETASGAGALASKARTP
jgi:undecaprenyl-phosphate 4-deoxy-4-formamido-L-arabinose transferase